MPGRYSTLAEYVNIIESGDDEDASDAANDLTQHPALRAESAAVICKLFDRSSEASRRCAIAVLRLMVEAYHLDVSVALPRVRTCITSSDCELVVMTLGLIYVLPKTVNFNRELKQLERHDDPEIANFARHLRKSRKSKDQEDDR